MEKQDFERWNAIKQDIEEKGNAKLPRVPQITEGEVWWAACGKNLGAEINGKNKLFERPVVIMKKLSRYTFMAIPLTSKQKTGTWYVKFVFKEREEFAAVCQARTMSVFRLYRKIGMLPHNDLESIKQGFLTLYK